MQSFTTSVATIPSLFSGVPVYNWWLPLCAGKAILQCKASLVYFMHEDAMELFVTLPEGFFQALQVAER